VPDPAVRVGKIELLARAFLRPSKNRALFEPRLAEDEVLLAWHRALAALDLCDI